MSGFHATKRQLRNSNRRWERKVLPVKVRDLEELSHELAQKCLRLTVTLLVQWVVIAALVVWILFLLEGR